MNYFEKTGYKKEQNRKDLTWEEAKSLPVYAMTSAGHLWQGDQKVSRDALNKPFYAVGVSSCPIVLYFFEKATFGEKKGVKLHLTHKTFSRAKVSYDLTADDRSSEARWVFITPDWKVFDMNGNPVKIRDLWKQWQNAPSDYDFRLFRNCSHDLRMVGQFREGISGSFACGQMLSPATVEILKEAGFDMGTKMMPTWQLKSKYSESEIPEDSYSTDWFVENLIHPNRVARRKKENDSIRHDYKYYCDLMGKKNFLVFEEEGQVYVAQKSLRNYYVCCGITVSYLKMQNREAQSCVYYSEKGAKKLASNAVKSILDYRYDLDKGGCMVKEDCENAIDQLLGKKQLLETTEVFKNLIPTLEEAKKALHDVAREHATDLAQRIFSDLSYALSPVGQKDRVFEETVKQSGLGKGIRAEFFLRLIGDSEIGPSLKKKTPYEQVELTKPVYYGLRKMIDGGVSIDLQSMIKGLAVGVDSWGYRMTKEEYLTKRSEFCRYLTADFLDLLGRTVSKPHNYFGVSYKTLSAWSWVALLRLAGKSLSSPLPEKIAAATRLLKKFDSDASLPPVFEEDKLRDYYRQVDELAPLGMDWPQKYEEFHVKNIMWFLGTIRGNSGLVNWAKNLIPSASFGRRVEILHEMQNQISALNKLEIEKAALQEMDKEYAPWKEQLKKALGWKGKNLGVFIPESLAELTAEGKILHHCVGSYKNDVAQRREGILFLGKLSCPETPYYTLDVVKGPSGKYAVRQCHGNCNSNPTPEIVEVLKQWAADTGKVEEDSISDAYGALCCL